jgi:hypothetical protein
MQPQFEARAGESPSERVKRLEAEDRKALSPAEAAELNSALAVARREEKEQRSPKGHRASWLGNK